jgi:hypothetical protein
MKPVYPSEQPQKSGSRGSGTLHLNFESDGATPGPTRIGGGKIGTATIFGRSPFRVTRSRRGAVAPLLLFKTGVAKQSFAFRHSEECPTTRRGDLYGRPLVGQLLK